MLRLTIRLFTISAIIGFVVVKSELISANTFPMLVYLHSIIAAISLKLLLVHVLRAPSTALKIALTLCIAAAVGSYYLCFRDLKIKFTPTWLVISHGLLALASFLSFAVLQTLNMRLFRRPFFLLMIHSPMALLSISFNLSLLFYFENDTAFSQVRLYCFAGCLFLYFTVMIIGMIDQLQVRKTNKSTLALELSHRFFECIILAPAVLAYKAWQAYTKRTFPSTTVIAIKGILILALFAGNYLDGNLAYGHHTSINLNATDHGNIIS